MLVQIVMRRSVEHNSLFYPKSSNIDLWLASLVYSSISTDFFYEKLQMNFLGLIKILVVNRFTRLFQFYSASTKV